MTDERQERVRQRAHEIWEREGRPHGKHDEHWRLAREEIEREGGEATEGGAAKARTPRRASAKAAAPGEAAAAPGRKRTSPREVTSEGTKPDGAPPAPGGGTARGGADGSSSGTPAGRRRKAAGAEAPEAGAKPAPRSRKSGSGTSQDM